MKKALFAGAASLALAAMPALGVFAETPTNGTHDVTVGEVDQTVYEVDITWGDMVFDWKYDSVTNSFNFKPGLGECVSTTISTNDEVSRLQAKGELYTDSACNTLAENGGTSGQYYTKRKKNNISVGDNTQNGRVAVSATFTPEDGYSFVSGSFGIRLPYGEDGAYEDYEGFQPVGGSLDGRTLWGTQLNLEKTSNPANPELITSSDKIGTVTINITDGTN